MKQSVQDKVYALAEDPAPDRGKGWNILVTAGILAGAVLLTELLRLTPVEIQSLLMLYIVAVLLISLFTSGYVWGIAAAVVSTFAYDLLVTEPRLDFSISRGAPITLFTMLLATFLISTLVIRMRNQAVLATKREQRTQLLYEISQELQVAGDEESIVRLTCQYLVRHFHRPAVFYTRDPLEDGDGDCRCVCCEEGGEKMFDTAEEHRRVHRIFQNGGADPAQIFDDTSPAVHYQPVMSRGRLLGLLGVYCGEAPFPKGAKMALQVLSGQVSLAMELRNMSNRQNHAMVEAEKEKMRSTLLRAISHDLRTPLTSILGASSTILEQEEMDRAGVDSLAKDIGENARWLIRMVENILTITKISKDTMKVTKTTEAAEEVVSQSVALVRGRFPDWQIHVRIPDELLLIPMDATLISQVLINLLENAVKNSPSGSLILVSLKRQGNFARFDISDNGWGIPEQVLENLFDTHSPETGQFIDGARGIGIGLSICQAIIEAHDGAIEGRNRKEGGAHFTFLLPLGEEEA